MERMWCGSAVALGLCALAVGSAPARAQAIPAIGVGQTLQGTLGRSDPSANDRGPFRVYRFQGRPGQRLSIRMTSADFDPFLSVGRTVAGITDVLKTDDDGGGETNARIRFTVPRTGEYLIVAQALDTTRVGGYTLALEALPTPVVTAPRAVRAGQQVTGALEETDPALTEPEDVFYDLYAFDAAANERVQIDLTAEDFDAYLEVGRQRGDSLEVLKFNDDAPVAAGATTPAPATGGEAPANLNSRLRFTAPAAGRYVIRARSLGGGATGRYTLALAPLPMQRIPAPVPVTVGRSASGTLSDDDLTTSEDAYYDSYVIRGRAGERLVITLDAETFDAVVAIGRMRGGEFQQIASNDDGPDGTNSRLEVTLDEAGEYVIRASSLSPAQTGAYTLGVQAGS